MKTWKLYPLHTYIPDFHEALLALYFYLIMSLYLANCAMSTAWALQADPVLLTLLTACQPWATSFHPFY